MYFLEMVPYTNIIRPPDKSANNSPKVDKSPTLYPGVPGSIASFSTLSDETLTFVLGSQKNSLIEKFF